MKIAKQLKWNQIEDVQFKKRYSSAVAGDIVLIAGKGHEKTQHTAEGIFPFSDLEEAERALFERQINGRVRKLLSNQFTDA